MGRQKIAAGNWKMNTTLEEGLQLARELANADRPVDVHTILAVPYTHLKSIFDQMLHVPDLDIAAQNCHHESKGAFTGEISVEMLKGIGIKYVILGHSERRQHFGETDELLKRKLATSLNAGLTPIFCCGESLEIRKQGTEKEFVLSQIKAAFDGLSETHLKNLIIAYEPIWAIGTGETATPGQAQAMHEAIRNYLKKEYSDDVGESISILYGGSVKDSNAKDLFDQSDIDGGLVGGASLNFESFLKIIHSF